ncbi:myosin-like protein [Scheffersomyces xylosifermentans]|uniref:myosin-like protein n=1 Tax=Scheffersomyces xylosifermentans TaxID=1304137 RepID=UPI00315CA843
MSSSLIDDLINICWSRIARGSSADSIFISQVLGLISEIENALSIKKLLKDDELKLLKQMIQGTPQMRLPKKEFKEFLSRLVNFPNFEIFLYQRCNISADDLQRIMKVPYKGPVSSYPSPKPMENYQTFSRPSSKPYQSTIFESKINVPTQLRSPPTSPSDWKLKSELESKQRLLSSTDSELRRKEAQNNDLVADNSLQRRKIHQLENEVDTLNNYIQTLEDQLSKRPGEGNSKRTLEKLKDRDRTIKGLEQLCNEYKKEITALEEGEAKQVKQATELIKYLNDQDVLIKNLQLKLALTGEDLQLQSKRASLEDQGIEDSRLKRFLLNLPFLKQYYFYYKYKQHNKSPIMFIINIVALISSAILALNLLEYGLYFFTWVFTKSYDTSTYVYDSYGTDTFNTKATFVWWKEIDSLEYLVYSLSEWLT